MTKLGQVNIAMLKKIQDLEFQNVIIKAKLNTSILSNKSMGDMVSEVSPYLEYFQKLPRFHLDIDVHESTTFRTIKYIITTL